MKKSMKFATALAGAAVVVAGGSAFTNAAAGFDEKIYNGFGTTEVDGVEVTNTAYTYEATTANIETINWMLSDQISDWTPYDVVAKVGDTEATSCSTVAWDDLPATSASIVCTWDIPVGSGDVTLSVTTTDLTP